MTAVFAEQRLAPRRRVIALAATIVEVIGLSARCARSAPH
jgi:hypothetical protein